MFSSNLYRWSTLKITIVIALLITLISGSALGATPIAQCGNLDSSGDYVLTQDIWNAGNSAVLSCINITSSNVNFDGENHFVISNSAVVGMIGVRIDSATSPITNVIVKNLTLKNFEYGFYVRNSSNSNFTGNNASNNSKGIYLNNSANNFIYNNYFNNSINVISDANFNYWNTTKRSEKNIINGSNLGGNFWANPFSNGFSQVCTNGDGDGICDQAFVIGTNNIDHLPLTNLTTTLPPYRFINGTVLDNVTRAGIQGVTVSTNIGNSTITNSSGFYSLNVTSGTYQLTASFDIRYYTNNSVTISTASSAVVIQDIDLVKKPTGNITGKVVRYSFITISSPQDIIYHVSEIPLVVSADRAISEWRYNLNGTGDVSFDPASNINIIAGQGLNDLIVYAQDTTGKWDSNSVSFFVDLIAPESVTDLHNVSYAENYINWTWADPEDSDLARVMVYLDGEYQRDVDRGLQYYNASVLVPGRYTIGTRTVNVNGTINATLVTNTSTTIMPAERYINGTVLDKVNRLAISGVIVSTNTGVSNVTNGTGYYSLKVASGTFGLTANLIPTYYINNSITVSTEYRAVVIQEIELEKKPTGNITGSVTKV